ncbi:MAG: bifunctional 2-C-methyl-D-erythritol 4-phosphate cytidylyltransferase/2-C-methyl-D-erythritol 2,4-cyclodiphosphate synthase [Sulfuricurvum sp.]|uniref:bifunctional 2-C-methyl-D-erythritol 4-phosphate cytidylyltransferase/2-C-methyl-D-erythritol 2,4-cyclodiphosphate synthase n=1 Tax=Sulfuricurvum sp. TaxID=2025608 RepID=UPI0025E701FC|nr:bifunctional 2-C-methyl-D-erythritol 4-phosphate cytidylyltransferase/2-C-methyl-D-erythritol 2,4-cyclodiphosphate synthase [Sulfuricurvum sp.]MCK9372876.1 bifunctional 2-C-methyl-D-erythritol 4-phosphate cytidylyltransferase/2-C-methyl-D-erythritol 2,4-cyclodiphosphate synthase [Sulfuricurvum sp.]
MSDLTLILLAAGNSSRFKVPVKKQWLRIGHDPLWLYVTNSIKKNLPDSPIIIVAHPEEISFFSAMTDHTLISGGETRQLSLSNALQAVKTPYVMVSDVARACIDPALIERLIAHKHLADSIVPVLDMHDTVVYGTDTIDRTHVKRVQTPQLSKTDILRRALKTDIEYTDESSAIVASGGTRHFVEGDPRAEKLTKSSDMASLECLFPPSKTTFTGNGFDVHPFEEGKPMVLGGVPIASPVGFKAHSDGDVAIHALIDALLGAACLGDIGMLFPDTDHAYKNIDSKELLRQCVLKLHQFGFIILHADITIIAQTPKISPYKGEMRRVLSAILQIPITRINLKATTTEHLGFIGRSEGVAVMATASVHYFDWTI